MPVRVAMVDATDVIFQADPFVSFSKAESHGEHSSIYFTEESRDYNLGLQQSNALWVRELYGRSVLSRLQAFPVLCSGFTMGHAASVDHYLSLMREQVQLLERKGLVERLRKRVGRDLSRGFDQGVHNVLARLGQLTANGANLTLHELQLLDGPVLHGNGARLGRHFALDKTLLRPPRHKQVQRLHKDTAQAPSFAVVHQYGKMRPKSMQSRLRRALTCREQLSTTPSAGGSSAGSANARGDVPDGSLPLYCTRAALPCSGVTWLGSVAWNRSGV